MNEKYDGVKYNNSRLLHDNFYYQRVLIYDKAKTKKG